MDWVNSTPLTWQGQCSLNTAFEENKARQRQNSALLQALAALLATKVSNRTHFWAQILNTEVDYMTNDNGIELIIMNQTKPSFALGQAGENERQKKKS